MSFLDDVGEFFSDFVKYFLRDVQANGGNLLTAAVQAAIEAAEETFADVPQSGAQKKEFAFGNIVAALEKEGVPIVKETITHTINGLIEIGVAKLNKSLGVEIPSDGGQNG